MAAFIELAILVLGVHIGLQAREWSKQREQRQSETQIIVDFFAALDQDRSDYAAGIEADERGKLVIPHGSSVYSYHFVFTRHNSPFAEFLMMAPKADKIVPMCAPQLLGESVPVYGRMRVSVLDKPGFGVEINPEVELRRPYTR